MPYPHPFRQPFLFSLLVGGLFFAILCMTDWLMRGYSQGFLVSNGLGALVAFYLSYLRGRLFRDLEEQRHKYVMEMAHHVNNSVQILCGRAHLPADTRESTVDAACERLIWVTRVLLPQLVQGAGRDRTAGWVKGVSNQ